MYVLLYRIKVKVLYTHSSRLYKDMKELITEQMKRRHLTYHKLYFYQGMNCTESVRIWIIQHSFTVSMCVSVTPEQWLWVSFIMHSSTITGTMLFMQPELPSLLSISFLWALETPRIFKTDIKTHKMFLFHSSKKEHFCLYRSNYNLYRSSSCWAKTSGA